MAEPNLAAQIDEFIADIFSQWNSTTIILVTSVLALLIYPLFVSKEPDIHPFLIARQSQASPIRQEGESAVYRASDLPYGYPLRSGLAVKDPGAPKWTSGRDGDLRDIWRQAVTGPKKEDGSSAGSPGKISTILGSEKVIEHDLRGLTLDINVLGKYMQDVGGKKMAVCLSNSVELLSTIFAAAFYNLEITLVPFSQVPNESTPYLAKLEADTLIAEAGAVALEKLLAKSKSIRRVIWVTKAGNSHLDWNEIPEGVGGSIDVTTWHDLVEEKRSITSNEPLPLDKETKPLPISMFVHGKDDKFELVTYTQENLIAATAATLASLPRTARLSPSDTLLPTIPLTQSYCLVWVLAALYSNLSIALNSVSGDDISLRSSCASNPKVRPTIVIASSTATKKFHADMTTLTASAGIFSKYSAWSATREIQAGNLPSSKPPTVLASLPALSSLRALYVTTRSGAPKSSHVDSSTIASLRLLLGTRISQALTDAQVAGAVAQSNLLDYRDKGANKVTVGPPLSSVEAHLVGEEAEMGKTDAVGKIGVKGPAVAGEPKGKAKTVVDVRATVDVDNTFVLV